MARQTAAQREALMEAELTHRMAVERHEWPKRLLKLVLDYTSLPVGGPVKHDEEVLTFALKWNNVTVVIDFPNENRDAVGAVYHIEQVEEFIADFRREEAEAERKAEARRKALAKLDPEERKLLGL